MARGILRSRYGAFALALACAAAHSAATQSDSPASGFVVLDRKAASKLLLSQITPEYPPVAKINFIQGQVRLQLTVNPEGHVREVHVVRGHPFLAASALKATSRWVYRPFVKGAMPTPFQTFVEVNFALRSRRLTEFPVQPERDLKGRVQPPEILAKPSERPPTASVRMRILVSDKGVAIDSLPVSGQPAHFDTARKDLQRWTFRPARWGTLSVPWYLDVDVPVESSNLPGGAGDPNGR